MPFVRACDTCIAAGLEFHYSPDTRYIVADNGGFFSISVAPDQRFPANAFGNFETISLTNFEVIQSTVATNGPRSPGAPLVNAGLDQTIATGSAALNAR